jgi:hypothetical protein
MHETARVTVGGLLLFALLGATGACRRSQPTAVASAGAPAAVAARYSCPMHPSYTSDKPGPCPICGMNLAPVSDPSDRRTVSGRAAVPLSPEARQMLGVRTDVVRRVHLYRNIRTAGRIVIAGRRPGPRPYVLAEVYETDLASLTLGMGANLMVSYLPGKGWRGRVSDISPSVDEQARTLAVRIEADDPLHELRPGMFADILLRCDLGLGLLVPDTAVIFSGTRRLAFVERSDDGQLEPRDLRLGPDVGDGFQVLSGLGEGERVVSSANFLIDSESSLRGAAALLAPAAKDRP